MLDRRAIKQLAKQAHQRGRALERDLDAWWPDAWAQLDHWRRDQPAAWPEWCLLPIDAPGALYHDTVDRLQVFPPPTAIPALAAVYAHRYAGSVWILETGLAERLLG